MPQETQAVMLPQEMRRVIGGADLNSIFNDQRISACKTFMATAREEFFTRARTDIVRLHEVIDQARRKPEADMDFDMMCKIAQDMKGHADLLGLNLYSAVTGHIVGQCCAVAKPGQKRVSIIVDLAKILELILSFKIEGDSESLKEQLNKTLAAAR